MNIVTVNHKNYLGRGADYVHALWKGVRRHMPVGTAYQFSTLSTLDIPDDVDGWWSKMYLFEPGRFKAPTIFFDLDTLITGDLSELVEVANDADFHMIADFFHPELNSSGVMAWTPNDNTDAIFQRWVDAGRPQFGARGDGGFISAMMPGANRLQEELPENYMVSLKASNILVEGLSPDTSVVCFHGHPRPHVLHDIMRNW